MDDTWRKYIYGWNVEDVERAKVSEAVSTSGSHLLLLSGLRTPDAGGFPHSNLIKNQWFTSSPPVKRLSLFKRENSPRS